MLKDPTISSGTTITALGKGGALDGATLNGTLVIDGANVTVENGLVLDGVVEMICSADPEDNHSTLTFDDSTGPQTLSTTGAGHIDLYENEGHLLHLSGSPGGIDSLNVLGSKLTIGPGLTINALSSIFGTDVITGSIDNLGNIDEDSGGTIAINFGQGSGSPVNWTNNGSIEVSTGAASNWVAPGPTTGPSQQAATPAYTWAMPELPAPLTPTRPATPGSMTARSIRVGLRFTWAVTSP